MWLFRTTVHYVCYVCRERTRLVDCYVIAMVDTTELRDTADRVLYSLDQSVGRGDNTIDLHLLQQPSKRCNPRKRYIHR